MRMIGLALIGLLAIAVGFAPACDPVSRFNAYGGVQLGTGDCYGNNAQFGLSDYQRRQLQLQFQRDYAAELRAREIQRQQTLRAKAAAAAYGSSSITIIEQRGLFGRKIRSTTFR